MKFRSDIQGLRAIAVIFVILFHINKAWLPGGFIGVDVFFVISGFIISSIIFNRIEQNNFSFINFYFNRVKRIVPAYYFMIFVVTIIVPLIFDYKYTAPNKVYYHAVLFNSNNYFAKIVSYFGPDSHEMPLLHTWTLAIEMKFYLFLPFILFFIKNKKYLFYIISILTIALLIYGTYEINEGYKTKMYFSLLARTPEFFIGVLVAIIDQRKISINQSIQKIISIIGLILLVLSAILIKEECFFPGAITLFPCVGTGLLILSKESFVNSILSKKPFTFIGNISYSLYLWHWPALCFFKYCFYTYELSSLPLLSSVLFFVSMSLISYSWIEKRPRNTIKLIVFLLVYIFYFAFYYLKSGKFLLDNGIYKFNENFEYPSKLGLNSNDNQNVEWLGDSIEINKKPTIMLLGNSHAKNMKLYFDMIGKKNGFAFKTLTVNYYPTIPYIKEKKDLEQYNWFYNVSKKNEPIVLNELKDTDIIIICINKQFNSWGKEILNFINTLDKHKSVIIFNDFPTFDKDPIRINKGITRNSNYQFQRDPESLYQPLMDAISKRDNLYFIDFSKNKVFENAPYYNDTIMYYNHGHLNEFGATKYALSTEKEFMNLFKKVLEKYKK